MQSQNQWKRTLNHVEATCMATVLNTRASNNLGSFRCHRSSLLLCTKYDVEHRSTHRPLVLHDSSPAE